MKGITKTIENETREQKGGFLGMLFGTLGASLLGNLLTGQGKLRAGYRNEKKILVPPHPLTNFEIQKYDQNEPWFNGVYSRDNFHKRIKYRAYGINLDVYADVGTHWIALYITTIEIIYFDSFAIEHVSKEVEKLIGNKNIKANKFRIQVNNLMCGYFRIGFIDFMLAGKTLIY